MKFSLWFLTSPEMKQRKKHVQRQRRKAEQTREKKKSENTLWNMCTLLSHLSLSFRSGLAVCSFASLAFSFHTLLFGADAAFLWHHSKCETPIMPFSCCCCYYYYYVLLVIQLCAHRMSWNETRLNCTKIFVVDDAGGGDDGAGVAISRLYFLRVFFFTLLIPSNSSDCVWLQWDKRRYERNDI